MTNIFVGNLSYGAAESEIRSMFEEYGTVNRTSIITDRDTGQARGFGFVEMPNDDEAQRAIAALNGRELHGRALTVNEARPKAERFGGGQRRFGSGGGSRRQPRW
ncbi:MAG TPA: RNA-binding protein [Bryobacteraceae bacterium]|nr:RNA-binding protein [Bryobacteraceae bacterium]HOL71370.1 RNA-binding protein [Bryobacteraceae bacterium]HOQ45518.1 RNA-binding protein [Bryobacteraceae bacterium]HPQ17346.1 RNA-binding protein [Bryobacteraceae bacterium]HPU73444.1 RNA-binding protein [Bryobacteraceae bacterium]